MSDATTTPPPSATDSPIPGGGPPPSMLRWRDGGWVLVLAALFGLFVIAIVLVPAFQRMSERPPGDGEDPASYLFALEPSLVPAGDLVAAQFHRDMSDPILAPSVMAADDVAARNEAKRGKVLVSTDPVIGVEIDGDHRAYPLSILKVHEIVNDELGGVPIVVSWNPLCGSAVVYDRRLPDGRVATFGGSGLVLDSNLLFYDRRAPEARSSSPAPAGAGATDAGVQPGGESLWSQLLGLAVTGPAAEAGHALERVPFVIAHWADWMARHPATTVLERVPEREDYYKKLSYDRYLASDEMLFPVDPMPGAGEPAPKTPCFVALGGAEPLVIPYDVIEANVDDAGRWRCAAGGTTIDFRLRRDPLVVEARTPSGEPAPGLHALYFAWRAQAGEIEGTRFGRVLEAPATDGD